MTKAAMITGGHTTLPVTVLKNLGVDAQKRDRGGFIFGETSGVEVSAGAAPVCVPTRSIQGFPFPHVFSNTCYFLSY